jgi:hypothetical protein
MKLYQPRPGKSRPVKTEMVGEVESFGSGGPSRVSGDRATAGGRFLAPTPLMGLSRSPKRSRACVSRYSVRGTPPRRLHGRAVFRRLASRHRSADGFHELGLPSRVLPDCLRRSRQAHGDPHGVCCPYSDIGAGGPRTRGIQPRYVPPSGFRTLLTVSSPPRFPIPETGAAHGVHPSERFPPVEPYAFRRRCPPAVSGIACSCSEDQELTMPRSFRALLTTEIRTRHRPRPGRADALMGFRASPEQSPHGASPASRTRPSCAFPQPASGRLAGRRSRGWTHARTGGSLAKPAGSLEVFHQDLSSVLPTTVVSCRNDPTGSEKICTDGRTAEGRSAPTSPGEKPGGIRRHPPPAHL